MFSTRIWLLLTIIIAVNPALIPLPVNAPSTDHWVTSQGTDAELSRAQNEPSVAISPVNNNVLVAGANDWRLGAADCQTHPIPGLGDYRSTDGGVTWTNSLIPFDGEPTGLGAGTSPATRFRPV